MTINQFRSVLYGLAKVLGDVQAVNKAVATKSTKPITRRLARRAVGKATGRGIGELFR